MPERTVYLVHGLRISSDVPLPLPVVDAPPDVTLTHRIAAALPATATFERRWTHGQGRWILSYRQGTDELRYEIDDTGTSMTVACSRPDADLSQVTLGVGMGALLHVRGTPPLHGNAVAHEGRAVVISGAAGAGKSVLAAMLVASGAEHVSDDVSAIEIAGGVARVHPGTTRMRLASDAVAAMGWTETATETELDDKLVVEAASVGGRIASEPRDLAAVYLLSAPHDAADVPTITPLEPAVAVVALREHFYGAAWLGGAPADLLQRAAEISARVRTCTVRIPRDLSATAGNGEVLLADLRSADGPVQL